jgi:hypothetical protein
MRRFSLALVAVGAFLIVMGPMVRWYAYPRLAVSPANERTTTGLVGENATVFDVTTLKDIRTTLHTTVRTTGDASTPSKSPGDVTYVNSTSTTSSDGVMRSRQVERMTFNARTGEASTCSCGDFISNTEGVQTPVVHQGLVAKFPFDTQKQTYQFWDSTELAANPVHFAGTTTFQGLDVYKFVQQVGPVKTGTMQVPLSLLGLSGDANVTADEMYSVDRTLYVEPNTGVIIQRIEAVDSTLDYQGAPRLTLTKATVAYDQPTIRTNVDDYGSQGSTLHLVKSTVPQVSFVLGLLSLIGGLILGRRRPATTATESREERHHAHA